MKNTLVATSLSALSASEVSCLPLPFRTTIGLETELSWERDTEIVAFRIRVEDALRCQNIDAAFHHAVEAVERFSRNGNLYGEAFALFLRGMICRHRENCACAMDSLRNSQELWEALGENDGIIRCLQERGGTLVQQADYTGAMVFFQECRVVAERIGDRRSEMAARSNIATIHIEIGDCATALEGLHYCLPYFEKHRGPVSTACTLQSMADAYNLLEQPEEAIRFAQRGYALCVTPDPTDRDSEQGQEIQCHLLSTLATSYQKMGKSDETLRCLQEALVLAESVGIPWLGALTLSNMGSLFIEQERFDDARESLERSLTLNRGEAHRFIYAQALKRLGILYTMPAFTQHSDLRAWEVLNEARLVAEACDSPAILVPIYRTLAELYERQQEFPSALACLRLLNKTEKRLFNEESDRRIKRMALEKAQQDAEIARRDTEILHLRNVELAEALAEAEHLRQLADERAHTDALTGLQNRRALDECLETEWEASLRRHRPFSVALFDIDFFKRINDTFGHAIGDETLFQAAQVLRSVCRRGDRLARYGGEEFAILFPDTTRCEAARICERLREKIADHDWATIHPDLPSLTISGGIGSLDAASSFLGKLSIPSDLIAEADRNLYRAKQNGRNRIVLPGERDFG